MLMQGLSLPSPSVCATQPLPPAGQPASSPPPTPTEPHRFHEPEDTTGRACVRGSSRQSTPVPLPVRSVFPVVPIPSSPSNMPLLQQATPPTKSPSLSQPLFFRYLPRSIRTVPFAIELAVSWGCHWLPTNCACVLPPNTGKFSNSSSSLPLTPCSGSWHSCALHLNHDIRERKVCRALSYKFRVVEAHRTSSNPLKTHYIRERKVCRVLSHKFGVVQAH